MLYRLIKRDSTDYPSVEDFIMTSPRAPKFSRAKRARGIPPKYQSQTLSVQPEILVVEDGSGLFPKIGSMLQNGGFQVILVPDADTALQEMLNYDIAAVIAGASREQYAGLNVLAAVKERRAEIKTMVVTRLVNPELPVQAYEMEIDDYIHWPLSGSELTGRLRGLLELGEGEETAGLGRLDDDAPHDHTLMAIGSLVDGFTNSLAMISQSLEEIRQDHLEGMEESLSEELSGIAAQVRKLGDNLRQGWRLGVTEPASGAKPRRFH
jgi:DNA-binding response OmpR family regulator